MHIVIIADPVDNQTAGIHVYTKRLIESLLKIDRKNKYTFIHPRENIFFENKNHFIIPEKKKIPGFSTYRKFIKIPNLLKKLKPDIVLETSHIGPFRVPKNTKRATIIHDLTPIIFPELHIKRSTIIHSLLLPNLLKNIDLIFTPSENTKKDIQKLFKTKNNIEVVSAGIDKPNPSPHSLSKFPKFAKISQPYILYFGTIEPRKNLEFLINIFLDLKKNNDIPHKLVLAGEIGWKSAKILEKAAEDLPGFRRDPKNIIITSYLSEEEKATIYKNTDIFVYPSLYEGFGLPPLEAMSYGVPVICSTGGSLKEIFENHALIFDPQDKSILKKHILELIKNPELRENLIEKGQQYSKQFTWESVAQKVIAALEKLC